MRDQVYVLGAGFSRDAGGPLTSEFLSYSSENRVVSDLQETPEFEAVRELSNGLPLDESNIEGILNYVSNLKFVGRSTIGRFSPQTILDFLTEYTVALLASRLRRPPAYYATFVDTVLSNKRVAILTFNYDLLLDSLLADRIGRFDYGFPAEDRYRLYGGLTGVRSGVPLLKLHGSINWSICSVCRAIGLHREFVPLGRSCPRGCSGRWRGMIVPPTWDKLPYATNLRLLWKQARDLLENASKVTVIGFSFSPLDSLAKDLFRRSFRKNESVEVHVHNGPNYNYIALEQRLGHPFEESGLLCETVLKLHS